MNRDQSALTATIIAFPVNPAAVPYVETRSQGLAGGGPHARVLQFRMLYAYTRDDPRLLSFATVSQLRAGGLVIGSDPFFPVESKSSPAPANRVAGVIDQDIATKTAAAGGSM